MPTNVNPILTINSALGDDDDWSDPSQLRPRFPFRRKPCDNCKSAGLKCERELNDVVCRNCTEGGVSDTCLAPILQPVYPPLPSSLDESRTTESPFVTALTKAVDALQFSFAWLSDKLYSVVYFIPTLILPLLLFVPLYYANSSLGQEGEIDQALNDFDAWVQQMSVSDRNNTISDGTVTDSRSTNTSFLSLAPPPPQPINVAESLPAVAVVSSECLPSGHLPLPQSVHAIHSLLLAYLRSRIWEWRILFALSGSLFTTAPAIFQIQGISQDPLPRSFAYLAVFRAISALVYAPIFLHQFGEQSYTRSVEFAVIWARETRCMSKGQEWRTPWIVLSLPASTTLWALVFYAVSLLTLIWRVGAVNDPADVPAPMSETEAAILRTLLTATLSLDVLVGVWAARKMSRWRREVKEMQRR
ncbi:hypothetical protein H0H92_016091 [Tricholoma furcatifolium]|nr:hypothetical protein H0H92_016091 [Tricholoma furcatifolium]